MTIKELRMSKGMSQEKMAEILGVDRSDLGKMENGKKRISGKIVDKIWYYNREALVEMIHGLK